VGKTLAARAGAGVWWELEEAVYGIPSELNLNDIVGSEIQQIRLGRYDVQLAFGSGRTIAVQGDLELFEEDQLVASWNDQRNWSSLAFQRLLNAEVLSYSVVNEKLLEIKFEGDLTLYLHDSSDQYETMQIYPEGFII